jgi:DNA repair and recombination protein RAD52
MNKLQNRSINGGAVKTEPFEPHEVDDIQSKLDKKLGPEYVSTRPGAGGIQVSYIEGWRALNLANQVFGFNGWFSEVKTISVDYLDERNGKFSVGLSVVVRVTLKDGSFHEDIGYGSLDNARTKAMAFEKAKKEAMTDGLKRALRCFGNAMGNCLYDKEYLSKISGVKCAPPDFDESNLFRFTDAPSRPATIPRSPPNTSKPRPTTDNGFTAPQRPVQRLVPWQMIPEKRATEATPPVAKKRHDRDDMFDDSLTFSDDINLESEDFNDEVNELLDAKLKTPAPGQDGEKGDQQPDEASQENITTNDTPSRSPQQQDPQKFEVMPSEIGFFKARVAEEVQKNSNLTSQHTFNPQFISPSIRRTVDPTKSTPIKRADVTGGQNKAIRYDNPRLMPNRQIGKPRYPPPRKVKDKDDNSTESGT